MLGASNSEFHSHVCLWPGWSNRLNTNENEENHGWNINNLRLLVEVIGAFGLISQRRNLPAVRLCELLKSSRNNHIHTIVQEKLWSLRLTPPPRSCEPLPITPWASFSGAEWTFTSRMDSLFRREQVFKHLSWPLCMFYTSQHLDNPTKPPEIPAPSPLKEVLAQHCCCRQVEMTSEQLTSSFPHTGKSSYYTRLFRGFRYRLFLFSPLKLSSEVLREREMLSDRWERSSLSGPRVRIQEPHRNLH